MKVRIFSVIALVPLLSLAMLLPESLAQGRNAARESEPGSVGQGRGTVAIVRAAGSPSLASLVAAQNQIQPAQRVIIVDLLRLLPPKCEEQIKNFYVRYDNPSSRGLAGKDSLILSGNVPDKEFRALLVHEMFGHVVDLGCLQGNRTSGTSPFWDGSDPMYSDDPSVQFYKISWTSSTRRRADSRDTDFVTGYAAQSDAFEDMAESTTFYFFHREEFRRMARTNPRLAEKFLWVQTYVFPNMPVYARSTSVWNAQNIPWDSTKLPYEWVTDVAYRK